jgi:ribosomal protein S18 acetylase RimI-like enzyme
MIEIVESNYTADEHEKIIVQLLNDYATDIMGGGAELSEKVKTNLVKELEKRENIHTVLAFEDEKPAGLVISIEGFSTFVCQPLLNIHDVVVSPEFRGKGISKMMFKKVEEIAIRLGCCKMTLEVLEGNDVARNLYKSLGFISYELDPKMGKALFLEKKL